MVSKKYILVALVLAFFCGLFVSSSLAQRASANVEKTDLTTVTSFPGFTGTILAAVTRSRSSGGFTRGSIGGSTPIMRSGRGVGRRGFGRHGGFGGHGGFHRGFGHGRSFGKFDKAFGGSKFHSRAFGKKHHGATIGFSRFGGFNIRTGTGRHHPSNRKFDHGRRHHSGRKFDHGRKHHSGRKFDNGRKHHSGRKFDHGRKHHSDRKFKKHHRYSKHGRRDYRGQEYYYYFSLPYGSYNDYPYYYYPNYYTKIKYYPSDDADAVQRNYYVSMSDVGDPYLYTKIKYYPSDDVDALQRDYSGFSDVRRQEVRKTDGKATRTAEEAKINRYLDNIAEAFDKGDYKKAVARGKKATRNEPDNAILLFAHCQALFANYDYTNAADLLRRALSNVDPRKKEVYYMRGFYTGDSILNTQIDILNEAVKLESYDTDLQLLLGYQLMGVAKFDQAQEALKGAQRSYVNKDAATLLIDVLQKARRGAEDSAPTEEEQKQEIRQEY